MDCDRQLVKLVQAREYPTVYERYTYSQFFTEIILVNVFNLLVVVYKRPIYGMMSDKQKYFPVIQFYISPPA